MEGWQEWWGQTFVDPSWGDQEWLDPSWGGGLNIFHASCGATCWQWYISQNIPSFICNFLSLPLGITYSIIVNLQVKVYKIIYVHEFACMWISVLINSYTNGCGENIFVLFLMGEVGETNSTFLGEGGRYIYSHISLSYLLAPNPIINECSLSR